MPNVTRWWPAGARQCGARSPDFSDSLPRSPTVARMERGALIFIVFVGLFGAMLGGSIELPKEEAAAAAYKASSAGGVTDGMRVDTPQMESADFDGVLLERQEDGHFYAEVEINGTPIIAMVDTGASSIALSRADARSAGVATSVGMPEVIGRGASGEVHGEYVMLDRVTLGHKTAEKMEAVVLAGGEDTLLGQAFLSKFQSVEIRGDLMLLR